MKSKLYSVLAILFPILFFISAVISRVNAPPHNKNLLTYNPSQSEVLSETTCPSPTAGCGTNYYWDSNSCSCLATTCTPPASGCGTNYYWDSSLCYCKPSTSGCEPPPAGCGSNFYWNTLSCSCVANSGSGEGDSGCVSPTAGCGSNYYWDSGSCTCKPNTPICVSPTSGCGSGYYWDSTNCYCRPNTTTCVPPTSGCGTNYYWDTPTCSCKPNTITCISPTYGCGSGYYWDSTNCYCKPNTTNCPPPTSGCGLYYHWNSATCSCVYNTPTPSPSHTNYCVSPTYGCGSGYYWDSTNCYCRSTSSACISPSYGCGTGYYWDSSACYCKPQTARAATITTTSNYCPSPAAGCGNNYHWDSSQCICKSNYSSTCTAPSAGCGTNYYWDSSICSCRPNTNCSVTTVNCGTNYYWDTATCSCRYYYSTTALTNVTPTPYCVAPSTGCGTNYYWDSSYCACRPMNTAAICSVPSSGCGTGWYWDQGACVCKSTTNSQTYYTTTAALATSYTQTFDRLSYEPPERIVCIKSYLTDTEFQKLRYLIPANQADFDQIANLGNKVKSCWGISTAAQITGTTSTPNNTPVLTDKCLLDGLGQTVYADIYKGVRQPTYAEHLVFEKCAGIVKADSITYITEKQEIPSVTDKCLKDVLKDNLYLKVKTGKVEVPPNLRKSVDKCFGIDPQPFEEGRSYKVPEETKACLLKAVGENRFNEINSSRLDPTTEEKKKAEACFSALNSVQKKFLPPPPESIYFTPVEDKSVNLSSINQKKQTEEKIKGGGITFSGKGLPDSVVYIYIFSEPIVVTTKTDENGDWVYELQQPLSGEKHVAYAAVKNTSGNVVRSDIFDFTVVAAEDDLANRFISETDTAKPIEQNFFIYYFIIIGCSLMAVTIVYIYFFRKKIAGMETPSENSDNGEGKGEAGSGPVN